MSHSTIEPEFRGQKILKESGTCVIEKDDLYEFANYLGINATREANLLWIAVKGLCSSLPNGWLAIEDAKGRIYYYNPEDRCSTWIHPADVECRRLLKEYRENPEIYNKERHFFQKRLERLLTRGSLESSSEMSKKFEKISLTLPEKRSVKFDLKSKEILYENESVTSSSETEMDLADKFGLLDAESLSPAFVRSPEPEEVNSLLRLTSLEVPSKMTARNLNSNISSPLPQMNAEKKSMNFLKPLSPISKLPGSGGQPSGQQPGFTLTKSKMVLEASIINKPTERIRNIDVLMDSPSTNLHSPSISPNSPQTPTTTPLNSKATPKITKTGPSPNLGMPISQEELQLKVDHEMALIDIRNQFEDERETEEENLREELEEFKLELKKRMEVEKEKLRVELKNELEKTRQELETKKKEQLKEIQDLNGKHLEEMNQLKTKLQTENDKVLELMEKELNSKKLELKNANDKNTMETKKKYAVEMAKMQLDLEKELQKKSAELKKENEDNLKTLEENFKKTRLDAEKDLNVKLEDWKRTEEAKLIRDELSSLEKEVQSKRQELNEINEEISSLILKKETLREETKKMKEDERPKSKMEINSGDGIEEGKDTTEISKAQPSDREDIQFLHQKVLRVDSYLQSFNEQLQSLSQIVQASQLTKPKVGYQVAATGENHPSSSSCSGALDDNTFTRDTPPPPPPPPPPPIGSYDDDDEFGELKELLRTCKRKLRHLEKRRFEGHAPTEFQQLGPQNGERNFRYNASYNSYWNQNLARKKACTVRRAQRFLGIRSKSKPEKISKIYRYDQESLALAKMAEKLSKKLDKEAKELSKIERKFASHQSFSKFASHDSSSSSSSGSESSSEPDPTIYKIQERTEEAYIPYTPLNSQMRKSSQMSPSNSQIFSAKLRDNQFSVENQMKQAWTDCFGDQKAPVIGGEIAQPLNSETLRTDHAKWMQKIEEMNRKIRQTQIQNHSKLNQN